MMKSWFNINLSERLSPHKRTKAKLLDFLATFLIFFTSFWVGVGQGVAVLVMIFLL